jgi:hypothetical protein
VETIAFLEALVRALGRGWSARYSVISPYGVYGVVLTSDLGGSVEIVPSRVRGVVVTWSPFVFARGTPHYDLHTDDGVLLRTPRIDEAIAHLDSWRRSRGAVARAAARVARSGAGRPRRAGRVTQVERAAAAPETLSGALHAKKLGQIAGARRLATRGDHDEVARELVRLARHASGDDRANVLAVLVAVAKPADGPELARYLDDPARSVQRVAIEGVKRAGYTAAVPALSALVLASDVRATTRKTIAVEAATAMKVLSGKRGAAALTGYLIASDPRVREAACVAFTLFASAGAKQIRPLLEGLLSDADPRVAKAARRALGTP